MGVNFLNWASLAINTLLRKNYPILSDIPLVQSDKMNQGGTAASSNGSRSFYLRESWSFAALCMILATYSSIPKIEARSDG